MEFRNQTGVSPGMVAAVAWSCVMSRFVLGALALIAAGWTVSAQAADLYGSRAPYTVNQPLNAYSWAGPYLGGNLGYAWGSVANNPTKPSGFVGGVQAGYNWQNGAWVFGVEGDIQATGAEDTFAPWKFSNPWFGTRSRPRRLRVQQHPVLRHRRSRLRRTARHHLRRCRNPIPMRAGRSASAPRWASPRTGAPRSNTSMSIWPTATSSLQARRTAIGSA